MYTFLFGLCLLTCWVESAPSSAEKLVRGHNPWSDETWYMAEILVDGKHQCGGTVISHRHILTVANCVWILRGQNNIENRVDVVTNSTNVNGVGGIFHAAERVVIHDKFVNDPVVAGDYDIAIIVLKVSKDTSHLRSVTLPRKNVPNGVFGTILGWGKEGDNLGFSETLKKSVFQMIDREHCSAEAPSEYLFENKFCAKEIEGFGTCGGDNGGGLVYNGVVYGVLSVGPANCGSGGFSYFTNVYQCLDFINQVFEKTFDYGKHD